MRLGLRLSLNIAVTQGLVIGDPYESSEKIGERALKIFELNNNVGLIKVILQDRKDNLSVMSVSILGHASPVFREEKEKELDDWMKHCYESIKEYFPGGKLPDMDYYVHQTDIILHPKQRNLTCKT